MIAARWIGLLAGAGLLGAGVGGLASFGTDDPRPKEDPPVATGESVTLWTVPLMPPLSIGGQEIHTVRIKGTPGGKATVELDPNPVVVDPLGNAVKTGLRAFKPVDVEMVPLPGSTPAAAAGEAARWRLYDLRPVAPTPAWPGTIALHLAMHDGPCGPNRLLVMDSAGQGGAAGEGGAVVRIVTMESAR